MPLPDNSVRDYWDGKRERLADGLEKAKRIEVYATEDIVIRLTDVEVELIVLALRDSS